MESALNCRASSISKPLKKGALQLPLSCPDSPFGCKRQKVSDSRERVSVRIAAASDSSTEKTITECRRFGGSGCCPVRGRLFSRSELPKTAEETIDLFRNSFSVKFKLCSLQLREHVQWLRLTAKWPAHQSPVMKLCRNLTTGWETTSRTGCWRELHLLRQWKSGNFSTILLTRKSSLIHVKVWRHLSMSTSCWPCIVPRWSAPARLMRIPVLRQLYVHKVGRPSQLIRKRQPEALPFWRCGTKCGWAPPLIRSLGALNTPWEPWDVPGIGSVHASDFKCYMELMDCHPSLLSCGIWCRSSTITFLRTNCRDSVEHCCKRQATLSIAFWLESISPPSVFLILKKKVKIKKKFYVFFMVLENDSFWFSFWFFFGLFLLIFKGDL